MCKTWPRVILLRRKTKTFLGNSTLHHDLKQICGKLYSDFTSDLCQRRCLHEPLEICSVCISSETTFNGYNVKIKQSYFDISVIKQEKDYVLRDWPCTEGIALIFLSEAYSVFIFKVYCYLSQAKKNADLKHEIGISDLPQSYYVKPNIKSLI